MITHAYAELPDIVMLRDLQFTRKQHVGRAWHKQTMIQTDHHTMHTSITRIYITISLEDMLTNASQAFQNAVAGKGLYVTSIRSLPLCHFFLKSSLFKVISSKRQEISSIMKRNLIVIN